MHFFLHNDSPTFIFRFDPGHYLPPLREGIYTSANGERGYICIHIFLNDNYKGGATSLVSPPMKDGATSSSDSDNSDHQGATEKVQIKPKIGSLLVFQNDIFYESSEVFSGAKYVLKTDVMYETRNDTGLDSQGIPIYIPPKGFVYYK